MCSDMSKVVLLPDFLVLSDFLGHFLGSEVILYLSSLFVIGLLDLAEKPKLKSSVLFLSTVDFLVILDRLLCFNSTAELK